jgi:hypothetical protein
MGNELAADDASRPPPPPSGGQPPLVLEYGQPLRRQSAFSRISPTQWAVAVGASTFVIGDSIGRTPALVAAATGLLAAAMAYVYARARAKGERWLFTDQLLLAGCLAVGGVMATLVRAKLVSNSVMWLPDNQTYPFKPAWALEPLWFTAAGLAWFSVVAVFIELRQRRRSSQPHDPGH